MRRGLTLAGLVLVMMGLVSCNQAAPSREPATVQAAITQPAVAPQTGVPTPRPGETVVTVFTVVPQPPSGQVTPTQDLGIIPAGATPGATTGTSPTAIPTQASGGTSTAAVVYTVKQGDTLLSIANQYGTTVQAIVALNNIADPDDIQVGQKLTIRKGTGTTQPSSGGCRIRHTVQEGEWVWKIARTYGVSPYDILAANKLTVSSVIQPGDVLCIP